MFNFNSKLFVLQPYDWRSDECFGCIVLLNISRHTEKNVAYITTHATHTKIDFCHGLCPTVFT